MPDHPSEPAAWFDGLLATDLQETTSDPERLTQGWWATVITFEGEYRFWRFGNVQKQELPHAPDWQGTTGAWRSSLDRAQYEEGVETIRKKIYEGEVYQVNLCRVLTAKAKRDPWSLAQSLQHGNPAPYSGVLAVPDDLLLVCASPELFLQKEQGRLTSGPIKGTGKTENDLLPKDEAENIMIVDLVRNDLFKVSESVTVTELLKKEHHPGLVHLVSRVEGQTRSSWKDILAALLPPGSVSGAPKSTALTTIRELETEKRGPYCGAIGYIDADRGTARLAVGIRTFWWSEGFLKFGTGAGITADSDPAREWAETELKARKLIGLADQASSRVTAASRSR